MAIQGHVFWGQWKVAGLGRLCALYTCVCVRVCMCVCQHSKSKTTGHHRTWQVDSTRQALHGHPSISFEVKRSTSRSA